MNFSELVGKTLVSVSHNGGAGVEEHILFSTTEGNFRLHHNQDCCESVYVEDICGDLGDLVGEVLVAEESTNDTIPALSEWHDCHMWTFYRIATAKGWVVIRWYGESNGYYGVGVDFSKDAA